MKEPYWFPLRDCLEAHRISIALFGGADGIRDMTMLESALGKPQQQYHYGVVDMRHLAAAYAAGIVRNHPFVDGNKRTGFLLAVGFLERNGLEFQAPEAEVVLKTLALAAGELDEKGYAEWLATGIAP